MCKTISKHLIGIFFEDINYAADGGLYAELVQNRDFEYSSKDGSHQGWDGTYAWAVKEGDAAAAVTIAAADPIHPNNPHYAVLEARPGVTLQNDGFDGISLKKGEKYDFSLFARVAPGSKGGKVVVCLLDQTGREIARSSVNVSSKEWKKQQTVLTANADVRAAVLSLQPQTVGTLHLDMISLFRKIHSRAIRTACVPTWRRRLPTCIHASSASPAAAWLMATALIISMTGKALSDRLKRVSRCAICGGIIRHADWATSSTSASAKI